jgi:hypothetical protein
MITAFFLPDGVAMRDDPLFCFASETSVAGGGTNTLLAQNGAFPIELTPTN